MNNKTVMVLAIGCLGFSLAAQAELLELKNGTVLNGNYAGGPVGTIRFEVAAGLQVVLFRC
jgi:hypothetical protein